MVVIANSPKLHHHHHFLPHHLLLRLFIILILSTPYATCTNPSVLGKIISSNFTTTSLVGHEQLVTSNHDQADESRLVSISALAGLSFKSKSGKHMMMIPLVMAVFMSGAIGWFIINTLLGLGVLNSCKHSAIRHAEDPNNMLDLTTTDVESQKAPGRPRQFLRRYFGWAKRRSSTPDDPNRNLIFDNGFETQVGPRRFSYEELVTATGNFSEASKVGQGGFGSVYKGFIQHLNLEVAVKRKSISSRQGIEEYVNEIKITSQLRHRNLVKLVGWCNEKEELLLVYEFIPNNSLDFSLFPDENRSFLLSWEARCKIVQGLASALRYLHEEGDQCVFHKDVKTSNVLLDSNFNAKLGDFGLATLVEHDESSEVKYDSIVGTYGYMAPEYLMDGKFSKKLDVYSFGIVALEIASGRKQHDERFSGLGMNMMDWIWGLGGEGKIMEAADPRLVGGFDEREMECLLIVGMWCALPDPDMRPPIEEAILVLNFKAPLPNLPSEMPAFPWVSLPSSTSSRQSAGECGNASLSSILISGG